MYNHNLACDDCDSYHRRRPVSRPLGAPQPSSNAPGADKDEEFEQDEHTVGTISSHSGRSGGGSFRTTSQIRRGVRTSSNSGNSGNYRSSSGNVNGNGSNSTTRNNNDRGTIGNNAQRGDSQIRRHLNGDKIATSRGSGNRSSKSNNDSATARKNHGSSSSKRPSSKRNRDGSRGCTRMDGHVINQNRVRTGRTNANANANPIAYDESEPDVGALPLRESYHRRTCLSWLDDLDWGYNRDRNRDRDRDRDRVVDDSEAQNLPYASVSLAVPNGGGGRTIGSNNNNSSRHLLRQHSQSASSITHSFSDNASFSSRFMAAAGISRNDEDDDEDDEDETTTHTVFSSSAPSRAAVGGGGGGGAVVAEVVDEAQLEAEFAERLKSRMVQATEIRSSETADKMAAHKRSSGGRGSNSNSKSKSSRNSRISHRSNKKETTREPSGAEDASPTKRKKLCFAGWFLALVVVFAIVLKVTLPTRVNKDDSLALNEDDSLVTGTNEVIDKGKNWWECPYEFTGGNSDNTLGENSKNPVSANSSSTQWPPSTENLEKENYLRHMVKQLSGLSFVAVKNNPQNLALQWMLADPYIFSGAIDNESNPASKLAERYALAVLYFSTSGESWFDDIGFLNYSSVCDWKTCSDCSDQKILHHSHYDVNNFQEDLPYIHKDGERNGVVCDANNQVIGLRLDHNNLIGTIPSELQVMGQMKSLSMSFNEGLSGTIPPELGELVKTSALKFARCSLKGTLPDSLRLLTELTLFSVYGNQLTGTLPESFLQVVAGLHNGDFGSNQFEGTIPNVFEPLSPLQNLYLDGNNFYGPIPSSIYFLTGLQILDVSNNNLEGSIAPQVSAMRDLRRFVLDENQFSGTLPVELAEMAYLEHFSASKNALSGTLPQDVLGMRKLAHLDLSFNNFTNSNQDPESVGELTSLVFLNLESNPYFGGYFPIGASGLKLSPLAEVRLKNTGIQGLEETMCEDASFPKNSIGMGIRIQANCLENGFVSCDCCTSCCESDGVDCVANTDEICHAHKNEFQTMWDEIIPQGRDEFLMECHCKDDDENLSGLYYTFCNNGYKGIDTDETEQIDTKHHICLRDNYDYTHYRTENAPEEKLICATNTNYGYTFDEGTGAEISFQNTIVYGGNSARWNGTSILFRSYSKGEGPYCAVWVDGEQCEECIHADCGGEDGGSNEGGFVISCRNLGSGNGSSHQGYTFDSCADNARSSKERQGKNGYLEIFHAAVDRSIVECYDDQSCSTGQLPIFLKFLQIAPERFRA